jgi:hypothetical protein
MGRRDLHQPRDHRDGSVIAPNHDRSGSHTPARLVGISRHRQRHVSATGCPSKCTAATDRDHDAASRFGRIIAYRREWLGLDAFHVR